MNQTREDVLGVICLAIVMTVVLYVLLQPRPAPTVARLYIPACGVGQRR